MIQRIQTVFLALVILVFGMLFFIPVFKLTILLDGVPLSSFRSLSDLFLLPVCLSMVAVVAAISIFLHKNRKRQLLMVNIGLLLSLLLFTGSIAFPGTFSEAFTNTQYALETSYSMGAFLIALFPALFFFAGRNIRKDEKLVKDADRLR